MIQPASHRLGQLFLASILWLSFAVCAFAQTQASSIDYDAWTRLAERAETVIEAGRASTPAMEDLRLQLTESRSVFSDAQTTNADRITTIQDQIQGLGALPEDGQSEPTEITDRRAELDEQLKKAQAPSVRALEAFRRADGLIREIDTVIRDRQTEEFLELGPTPLDPFALRDTVTALTATVVAVANETKAIWENPVRRAEIADDAIATGLYLILALLLVIRGRHWMARLTGFLLDASRVHRGQMVAAFIVSLGEILIPFFGVLALVQAITSTGLLGLRGGVILDTMPSFALIVFASRWLGGQVFSPHVPMLALNPLHLREGRFYASILGLLLGLFEVANQIIAFEAYAPSVIAVIRGIMVGLAALMLARISLLVLAHLRSDAAETPVSEDETTDSNRASNLLGLAARAAFAVSILAPVASAVGYGQLGAGLIFPTLETLGVIALLSILYRLTRQVYAAVRGTDLSAAYEALWPVLVDLTFMALSIPVLALVWGARVSDLTEVWTQFLAGVSIGGAQISPASFLTFAIVFAALYAVLRMSQAALKTSVLPKTGIDPGGQVALISGIGYVGIMLAAVIAITAAGIDLSNLALVAGALSIGIGFGLQTIVSNFVAGIILLIERPVSEGDWIEVNGTTGLVRDISVRSTRIETFDRTDVIVPNADLISGAVTNWTRFNLSGRLIVPVGVAYGTDTKRVEKILQEIAEAHPMVALNPKPNVLLRRFGADSLDFEIRVILRDINWIMSVHSDINHEIAKRFGQEGIEIPFAQRDVWLRNPETLGAQTNAEDPAR